VIWRTKKGTLVHLLMSYVQVCTMPDPQLRWTQ
jgi:hypothetical protein